ncbi:MAG: Txe/YoeB family addiction module toxin [Cytophagales bacterium]|nr:Txe/YoeB family addiction module toxin [Cytophagales bacterium]
MEIDYSNKAKKDLVYWQKSGDTQTQQKISTLLESISISPYSGIGKPEPLKYDLSGLWLRRINREHRIVYEVKETSIIIHSLRYHYYK